MDGDCCAVHMCTESGGNFGSRVKIKEISP